MRGKLFYEWSVLWLPPATSYGNPGTANATLRCAIKGHLPKLQSMHSFLHRIQKLRNLFLLYWSLIHLIAKLLLMFNHKPAI
jgi:hypothetical protein